MGTTLYHWTSRDAMKLILASKKLELEGTEYMAGLREGYSIACLLYTSDAADEE